MLLNLGAVQRGLRALTAVGFEGAGRRKQDTVIAAEEEACLPIDGKLGHEIFLALLFLHCRLVREAHALPEGVNLLLLH